MESWTIEGTVHTPVEVFTGSSENKHDTYVISEMQVKGCSRMYLGIFLFRKDEKRIRRDFIANFRVGPHGIPREEAIARLKAKAE